MKLSEQIRSLKQELYDNEATASNVRDQLGILADHVERLAKATEALAEKVYQTPPGIHL
jgi:hypothetical protein